MFLRKLSNDVYRKVVEVFVRYYYKLNLGSWHKLSMKIFYKFSTIKRTI